MATKPKPALTQKNIDYFKELIIMVEQGDQEQIDRLTFLWQAVKRYNARLKSGPELDMRGQLGILPEDDVGLDNLTRTGEIPGPLRRK